MLTFPTLITGTITGLRISSVDGTAFIDNCAALIPYADGNRRIEIYDSSNRMLKGILKSAGGGSEGLGDELITEWANDGTYPYETFTSSGVDISEATETGTAGRCVSNALGTAFGRLYKAVIPFNKVSGGGGSFYVYTGLCLVSASGFITQTYLPSSGTYTLYTTQTGTLKDYLGIRVGTAVSFSVSSPTFKQVLTPSSSGVTIVSTKGGAIYNFASKDASFTYNAASYRYAVYDTLKVSRPTRYMGVSTHNI